MGALWQCPTCKQMVPFDAAHSCEAVTELQGELSQIELLPERPRVKVVIDVAEVLKDCSTTEVALGFLRGVADIFMPKEATDAS